MSNKEDMTRPAGRYDRNVQAAILGVKDDGIRPGHFKPQMHDTVTELTKRSISNKALC